MRPFFFLWRDQSLCSLIRGIAPNRNFLEENFPFYLPHNFHLSAQQFAQIIEGYIITNAERQTINLVNPLPREPWDDTYRAERENERLLCFYDSQSKCVLIYFTKSHSLRLVLRMAQVSSGSSSLSTSCITRWIVSSASRLCFYPSPARHLWRVCPGFRAWVLNGDSDALSGNQLLCCYVTRVPFLWPSNTHFSSGI